MATEGQKEGVMKETRCPMTWHKEPCELITKAPYLKGVKRNALIEVDGVRVVVPARALRRNDVGC